MQTVAILMTVFNHREKALRCLETVFSQADGLSDRYTVTVYLNDDGSTDGLYEAVAERFPTVRLTRSNDLYWCRGLRRAWAEASADHPDFYLWLDFDTILHDGSLFALLDNSTFLRHKAIVAGSINGPEGRLMYGGRTRGKRLIAPDSTIPVPCDMFDGNLVLVPRDVYEKLGFIDERYRQSLGDYDYGIRASNAGIARVIAPGVLADCQRRLLVPEWQDHNRTLRQRMQSLNSPKGRPYVENFTFDLRCTGFFRAVWNAVVTTFQVLFPK